MMFCILIPVYNNFEGLIKSLASIVFDPADFLVLVVDDGSIKPFTSAEINQQLCNPLNIQVVRLNDNIGITGALNLGLNYVYRNTNAKYIARLDCGDTCSGDRFVKQVAFLELNKHIQLVGSWCYFREPESGSMYRYITPLTHSAIVKSMHFRNVFIHPAVMWRIEGTGKIFYPESFPYAEDYALFNEIIRKGETAIIDEQLVTCEVNSQGISISKRRLQLKSRFRVISMYGSNKWWKFLGKARILLLLLVPHNLVYLAKKIFSMQHKLNSSDHPGSMPF